MDPNPKPINDLDKGVNVETIINMDNAEETALANKLKEENEMELSKEQINEIANIVAIQLGGQLSQNQVQQALTNAAQLKTNHPEKDERWFLQRWAEDYGVYLGTAAAAVLIAYFIKSRFFDSSDAVELGAAALNLLE